MHEKFIEAIHEKNIVEITVNTTEKGIINRRAVPYDYATGQIDNHQNLRYHFHTLDSPEGNHNLSVLPNNLYNLHKTSESFNPADYVDWTPNWTVDRDWGDQS